MREGTDVLEAHVVAAVHEGPRLAPEDHPLGRANARAVVDPLLDEVRRYAGTRTRVARDVHRITSDGVGYRHSPDEPLELDDVVAGDRVRELRILQRCRRPDDFDLLIFRQ